MKNTFAKMAATGVMLAMLSACTMYHGSNSAYLPDRSGIQEGQTVTVGNNENIYTVAKKYNVSMRELISLNGLKPPFEIRPGQSLTLPAGGTSFGGNMPAPEAAPLAPVERNSLSTIEHAPVASESLAPITAAPAPAPTVTAPASTSPFAAPTAVTPKPAPQSSLTPATAPTDAVQALNHASVARAQTATTMSGAATTAAVATTAPDMIWPVQGPIVSGYGAKGAGLANDGVNISAPKGSPVVASAPGTVVYAGDEMKGFGNLVLIRHEGDWVTAYAHLDRVLVKKDTVVAQGDEIGTVGKTGNAASPQVHFEVRQGGKAVDPTSVVKNAG